MLDAPSRAGTYFLTRGDRRVGAVVVNAPPEESLLDRFTAQELAVYLRVNRSTVYRLLKKKQLPGFRIGSEWRFQMEEVNRWFKDKGPGAS